MANETRLNMTGTCTASVPARHANITEENIRTLVDAFYNRVRDDVLIGPIFNAALDGHWDEHLPKMYRFWASFVLGTKTYQGNVPLAHRPFSSLTPQHFNRWLYLFLDTVESYYEPAVVRYFMEPALRVAQRLQLNLPNGDDKIPVEQQALIDRFALQQHRAQEGRRCRPVTGRVDV